MEFLKDLALPQSAEHIELMHYMLVLVLFLFIPFISAIFWGTALSLFYKRREKVYLDEKYRRFSKDVIELVTINKWVGIILGVVPVFTSILIFSQLLQQAETTNLSFLAASLILITVSLIFIYGYRYSFEKFKSVNAIVGLIGLIILFAALWVFVTGMTVAAFFGKWTPSGSISDFFTSIVIIRFIFFLVASFAVTGGAILFGFFYADNARAKADEEYGKFVKNIGLKITFTATILLPVIMFFNLLIIPGDYLSGGVFAYIVIGIFLLFLGYHFLYMILTRFSSKFTALLFFTLLFTVLTIIISDQMVISNSTKKESVVLAADFEKYLADLKGESGPVEISGEEIYKVKCASCHTFETKLVGPPHNEVVPKYFGKEIQLIAFIRNPVKINPDYPPMPNPGLKPNEAKAVADYVLEQVRKNLGK